MPEYLAASCPYCGEEVEIEIDPTGGAHQRYVQDCPVCCQPWQVEVNRERSGEWEGTLRTTDE